MPTTSPGRMAWLGRIAAAGLGAVVLLAPTTAVAGPSGLQRPSTAAAGLAVSYTTPPPSLVLTPYASVPVPIGAEGEAAVPEVAVLPDGGTVVVDRASPGGAYLVGRDGTRSGALAIDAVPQVIVATAGPVVYGLIPGADGGPSVMAAIALAGPNTGRVVATNPLADPAQYVELAVGSFGNGPDGVLDRTRQPGAVMIGHVDTNGGPVTIGGLRGALSITPENVVADVADPSLTWPLTIERHPEAPEPFAGESPPSPGADGTSVYWTSIGPAARPTDDFSPALQHVIAVLRPGGTGQWYSIPDGWSVASSDVGGTVFIRRIDDNTVELARLDPAATGPAPAPIPPLAEQCDEYGYNDRYPLRLCDSGPAVQIVQQRLRSTIDPALAVDGFFGPLTDRAVRRYQQANGLEVDGLVGLNTWRSLTEGLIEGDDADGSGLIDPSELIRQPVAGFPAANTNLTQGGTTWAVVLAGSADFEDPLLAQALAAAADAGYVTGPTDCDSGAAAALGISSEIVYTVSVYFASEADARAAQAAFAARDQPGTVAQVETFCLD